MLGAEIFRAILAFSPDLGKFAAPGLPLVKTHDLCKADATRRRLTDGRGDPVHGIRCVKLLGFCESDARGRKFLGGGFVAPWEVSAPGIPLVKTYEFCTSDAASEATAGARRPAGSPNLSCSCPCPAVHTSLVAPRVYPGALSAASGLWPQFQITGPSLC